MFIVVLLNVKEKWIRYRFDTIIGLFHYEYNVFLPAV